MTNEEMQAKIAELEAANTALTAAGKAKMRIGVTEKGAVGLYGVRRFPLTFYATEWAAIFEKVDEIKAFIEENKSKLSFKA